MLVRTWVWQKGAKRDEVKIFWVWCQKKCRLRSEVGVGF